MDREQFKEKLLEVIDNVDNPYHPFVWINGEPQVGEGTYIGGFSEINAKHAFVSIGKDCDIASFVAINVADSHMRCIGLSEKNEIKDIIIGDSVFIGSHSVVLGGAKIGSYSVIGAGTVVTESEIPPFSLVTGNPMVVRPGYYKKSWELKNGKWNG